jgi:tripartite-type tricarboxylate transporter receptor subunit TctC
LVEEIAIRLWSACQALLRLAVRLSPLQDNQICSGPAKMPAGIQCLPQPRLWRLNKPANRLWRTNQSIAEPKRTYQATQDPITLGRTLVICPPYAYRPFGETVNLPRRRFLQLAAGALTVPAAPRPAWSQAYPTRPVRIIVGLSAGGSVDIVTRLIAQRLSERLGHQFLVENRPGAASNIATEAVVRAPADGYTLLVVLAANAINATLYDNLNFNLIRDIALVAGMVRVANVMEINPSVPAKTVPEFIAYAKANPGKISFASGGKGSSLHVIGELFKIMAGIEMVHVPYRGGAPALIDLLGGRVQVMFDTIPQSIDYIRDGKLRALAVTTVTRSQALPEVPTMSDFVPGFEAGSWWGVGAPSHTPVEIVETLNREINAALADPAIKKRLAELGTTPLVFTPAEFGAFVAAETEKWANVVRFSGAKEN